MIFLRDITICNEAIQQDVLKLRNESYIRSNMYTEHLISTEEHLNWISKLKSDSRNIIFVVLDSDQVKGVASVNNIKEEHKVADWAFYLDKSMQGKGLGGALEYSMLKYVFDKLHLQKLNCQVLDFNEAVVSMHKKFGFTEEGRLRKSIIKNNEGIDVVLLGMTKVEWDLIKLEREKYLVRFGREINFQEKER